MGRFKARQDVIVRHDGSSHRGTIWSQNDFRPPEMEYAVMLENTSIGELGLVFVGEDKLHEPKVKFKDIVRLINNSPPHIDGKNKIQDSPFNFNIEKLIEKSVEPKRNKDGIIMISKDDEAYETKDENWGDLTVGDKHKPVKEGDPFILEEAIEILHELPPDSPLFDEPEPPEIKIYKKKPEYIEALQFTGSYESESAVAKFTGGEFTSFLVVEPSVGDTQYFIEAFDGDTRIHLYDYILKDSTGNLDVLSKDDFEENYERALPF